MRGFWLAIAVLLLSLCGASRGGPIRPLAAEAGPPRFAEVVVADDRVRKTPGTVFVPGTPVIHVFFTLADVPPNTMLKCVWIAEKTRVGLPNREIDSLSMPLRGPSKSGGCSLRKPGRGWPAGDYRVEMFLAGRLAHIARFRVEARVVS